MLDLISVVQAIDLHALPAVDGAGVPAPTQGLDWTVVDTYSCNGDCGGFTVESDQYYGPVVAADSTAAPAAFQGLDWTVRDVYSCNIENQDAGDCGGFTVESDKFYGPTVAADATAAPAAFQSLDWTVTDTYTCNSDCGGFTVESDQYYGPVVTADAASAPAAFVALDWTVVDTYSCNGDCGGFTVESDKFYGPTEELAVPVVGASIEKQDVKLQRPGMGHFLLAMHSCTMGAVAASITAGGKMLEGKTLDAAEWQKDFEGSATDHAAAVTPVGAYLLKNHVFAQPVQA